MVIPRAGTGAAGRKRIRVNGVPRRAPALAEALRVVLFAPEEMLLMVGSPALRRAALDGLATARSPAYGRALATYGRALQQRNSLLRAIREEQAGRDQLRLWDGLHRGGGWPVVAGRLATLADLGEPLAAAHAEIAPGEGRLDLRYVTNAPSDASASRQPRRSPGASPRRPRRRSGTDPPWSVRIATISSSTSTAGRWPRSPRAVSSGPRSWPSSWPSSTC